jgi:sugar lactone lactonase YvrE
MSEEMAMTRLEQENRIDARPLPAFWRLQMLRKSLIERLSCSGMWQVFILGLIGIVLTGTAFAAGSASQLAVSGISTPAQGLANKQTGVAVDACGNVYALTAQTGEITEIPAGGGTPTAVSGTGGGDGWSDSGLFIDATKSNLYIANGKDNIDRIPISNCVLQTGSTYSISIGNLGGISYWFTANSIAADASGNIFIATNNACCASANELLEENSNASTGATLLSGLSSSISSITVDASNNIYFTSGGALYELVYTPGASASVAGTYATSAVAFGGTYNSATGVSLDASGNMYVTDNGASILYEIPFESGNLNPKDEFVLASGVSASSALAVGTSGDFYFANNDKNVYDLTPGRLNLGSVAVSGSAAATVNVTFNAASTPAAISVISDNGVFKDATTGTCQAKAYIAGSNCTVNLTFSAKHPGTDIGGLELTDASNNVLATAYLSGTGLGAGITLDSGAVTAIGSGFTTPESIAVTSNGGFIADSGANAVLYFATPTSAPVSIGNNLSKPLGVAVDGAGNVIIADTGKNQIVEVPVINGALTNADQVAIISSSATISGTALSAPSGVTIDPQGNLYIADTGNNRVVYLPYTGSWNVANAMVLGSSFSAPLATAIDPSGNLYIADSGSGQIYKLPAPANSSAQQLVAVGFNNPSALATDASGSLFVVDQGANNVLRIPNINGALDPNAAIEVGFGVDAPYGVAVDATGDLYVTDATHAAAYQIDRISTTDSFGTWALNEASGPFPVKVENEGNQDLIFNVPFYTAAGDTGDFSLGTSTGAESICADGAIVASGAVCELDAIFTPAAAGTRTDTLVLQSNAQNAAAPQVVFTGAGTAATATTTVLAITSPTGTPSFGQSITLSATVAPSSGSGTPTGTAQLLVDGVIAGQETLSSGSVATFSLPLGLTGGSHSLQAVYLGTTSFAGSISLVKTVTVSTAPTTSVIAFTTPYTNPQSVVSGGSVTLTVSINFAGVGIPTGTVAFATGSTALGTAAVVPVAGGLFQASLSTTALPVGTDTITATYSGDANYVGSVITGTVIVVSAPKVVITPSGTSLTASSSTSGSITISAVSEGGFNGVVGYQCDSATLPANATCVFSPGQVVLTPSTSSATYPTPTVTMTLAINQPPQTPTASKLIWWLALPTGLLLLFARRRLKAVAHAGCWNMVLLVTAIAALSACIVGSTGCNNSSTAFATPAGSSTVTVIAYADPYKGSVSDNKTTPCTTDASNPCTQQSFSVNVTVQ